MVFKIGNKFFFFYFRVGISSQIRWTKTSVHQGLTFAERENSREWRLNTRQLRRHHKRLLILCFRWAVQWRSECSNTIKRIFEPICFSVNENVPIANAMLITSPTNIRTAYLVNGVHSYLTKTVAYLTLSTKVATELHRCRQQERQSLINVKFNLF